jgi:hypothetical protein
MDLTLVVLAAGLSTRYGALKQVEPVGPSGEALMDYAVYDAVHAGFTKVVLVTRRELEGALREHMGQVFGTSVAFTFAHQELDALPPGFTLPAERRKPWGTGHAVLSAEAQVNGPFVAINADDFYGASAYAALAGHLRVERNSGIPEFAAAGYTLRDTLSAHGGVSRGVCELDADGYLTRVTEVKNIEDRDGALAGVTVAGQRYALEGGETISMNIWAATRAAFPLLRERFASFLEDHLSDPDSEFLLSTAVNDLISEGRARVKVIPSAGPWLGVTFQEDRRYVTEKLGELVEARDYPADISAAMRRAE